MKEFNYDKVEKTFDKTDQYLNKNTSIRVRVSLINRLLKNFDFKNFIEVGCGDGTIALSLLNEKRNLKLVDISPNMIELAKKQTPYHYVNNVSYSVENVVEIESVGKYDLILSIGLLAHLPDYNSLFDFFQRSLVDEGKVILQWTEKRSVQGWILLRYFNRSFGTYKVNDTSGKEIIEMMKIRGFKLEKRKIYTQGTFGLNKISHFLALKFKMLTTKMGFLSFLFSERIAVFKKV